MEKRLPTQNDAKRPLNEWIGDAIRYSVLTDVGLVRENNQDSLLAEPKLGLFMVADGMGGRAGGEVASSLAIDAVRSDVGIRFRELLLSDRSTREIIFKQALNAACLQIY